MQCIAQLDKKKLPAPVKIDVVLILLNINILPSPFQLVRTFGIDG